MPRHAHHPPTAGQLLSVPLQLDSWWTDVMPRVPAQLEVQARALGAFQRTRGVACAADLLRVLLAYVLCCPSFRLLGAWAMLLGLANLSEAAWRKRLRQANAWLLWLLSELCAAPLPASGSSSPWSHAGSRRILLIDATTLGTPGGTGDDWRVHLAYNFSAGCLSEVVLSDRRTGESLDHYRLQPGDIVVRSEEHTSELQSRQYLVCRLLLEKK